VHPAHDVEHTAMGASVVTSAGYSNADKHRAIRVASGRTMPHRTNQIPGRYDITMHPVEPGFVIAEGLDDRLGEVDATTAVHVQRPGQVWVAPGAELMQIHDYVSEVVIPTLRTGGVASPNLPRQVRLGDTGDTDEQRIEAGGDIPAHIRCGREALAPAREVMAGACRCCRHLRAGIKPASATAAGTPPGPAAHATRPSTGRRSTSTVPRWKGLRPCGFRRRASSPRVTGRPVR